MIFFQVETHVFIESVEGTTSVNPMYIDLDHRLKSAAMWEALSDVIPITCDNSMKRFLFMKDLQVCYQHIVLNHFFISILSRYAFIHFACYVSQNCVELLSKHFFRFPCLYKFLNIALEDPNCPLFICGKQILRM